METKQNKVKIFMMNTYDHTNIGGTETFDYILTKQLKLEGYKITSLNERVTPKNNIVRRSIFDDQIIAKGNILIAKFKLWLRFRNVKNTKVIMNSFRGIVLLPKKFLRNNKVIIQQHFTAEHILSKLNSGLIKVVFNKRKIYIDKLVVFSNADKEKFEGVISKEKIDISCLTTSKPPAVQNEICDRFVYIGRLADYQKNITMLCNLFHENEIKIDIYGYGPEKDSVENISLKSNYVNFKGIVEANKVKETFAKYNANILCSSFEGMPFTIIEAASVGTPTITTDSFLSAKEMFKNNKIGILTNKDEFIKQIKNFNRINHKPKEEFDLKYSPKSFTNRWINIIEKT